MKTAAKISTAKTRFQTAYGPRIRVPAPVTGISMTEQHHKKSCDINSIVAKYQKTGLVDHINKHQAKYGDVSGYNYKTAQDLVAEQKTIFYELPSQVRAEFENDPANYLDLMQTDEGLETLGEMLTPVEEPEEQLTQNEPESESLPERKTVAEDS